MSKQFYEGWKQTQFYSSIWKIGVIQALMNALQASSIICFVMVECCVGLFMPLAELCDRSMFLMLCKVASSISFCEMRELRCKCIVLYNNITVWNHFFLCFSVCREMSVRRSTTQLIRWIALFRSSHLLEDAAVIELSLPNESLIISLTTRVDLKRK